MKPTPETWVNAKDYTKEERMEWIRKALEKPIGRVGKLIIIDELK